MAAMDIEQILAGLTLNKDALDYARVARARTAARLRNRAAAREEEGGALSELRGRQTAARCLHPLRGRRVPLRRASAAASPPAPACATT